MVVYSREEKRRKEKRREEKSTHVAIRVEQTEFETDLEFLIIMGYSVLEVLHVRMVLPSSMRGILHGAIYRYYLCPCPIHMVHLMASQRKPKIR